MLKRVLLFASAVLVLATAGSADIPIPPCYPNCSELVAVSR